MVVGWPGLDEFNKSQCNSISWMLSRWQVQDKTKTFLRQISLYKTISAIAEFPRTTIRGAFRGTS